MLIILWSLRPGRRGVEGSSWPVQAVARARQNAMHANRRVRRAQQLGSHASTHPKVSIQARRLWSAKSLYIKFHALFQIAEAIY